MTVYHVIGLMSGSSLDGLDVCYIQFNRETTHWTYQILAKACYGYEVDFREKLRHIPNSSAFDLARMHTEFSKICAGYIQQFFQEFPESKNAELIVSHGQTIFHQPEKSFTTQIGCGATLAALTGKQVVCDLRTYDVALGGQGAPLVPFGEQYLFPEYTCFINIGGICNISIHHPQTIQAFDVCPGNTLLNLLANQKGLEYDDRGHLAQQGHLHQALLESLSKIPFYQKTGPKSLGTEQILSVWQPVLDEYAIPLEDKLATVVEHISTELDKQIKGEKILITGGGALNQYLIRRIQAHTRAQVIIPDVDTIQFKEALIVGFVGLMRLLGHTNFLSSVTGAQRDNMGGALYG